MSARTCFLLVNENVLHVFVCIRMSIERETGEGERERGERYGGEGVMEGKKREEGEKERERERGWGGGGGTLMGVCVSATAICSGR